MRHHVEKAEGLTSSNPESAEFSALSAAHQQLQAEFNLLLNAHRVSLLDGSVATMRSVLDNQARLSHILGQIQSVEKKMLSIRLGPSIENR